MLSTRRNPTTVVLVFYAVVVSSALLVLLANHTGNRSQAFAAWHQISHTLVQRTRVAAQGSDACLHLCYLAGVAPGVVQGSLSTAGHDHAGRPLATAESRLELRIELYPGTRLPGDPKVVPLRGLRLHREDASSTLVVPGGGQVLELAIDTAGGPLAISNRQEQGAVAEVAAGSSAPSELRKRLLVLEHGDEQHPVAVVLARLLRARICDSLDDAAARSYDTALVIVPGVDDRIYQLELRALGQDLGVLQAQLTLWWSQALYKAELRVLPAGSDLGKPAELYLAAPPLPGEPPPRPGPHHPGVGWLSRGRRPQTTVDLSALLARTAWLPPEHVPGNR